MRGMVSRAGAMLAVIQGDRARALELARDREQLAAIREKLAYNRLNTPLFDTKSFTRNIESVYDTMFERYQAGLTPESIKIF